ncbi:hypothetical protein TorRG33x02_157080, partial [Trema orientale]
MTPKSRNNQFPHTTKARRVNFPFQFAWKAVVIGYGCGFVVWIVRLAICDCEKVQLVFHDFSK